MRKRRPEMEGIFDWFKRPEPPRGSPRIPVPPGIPVGVDLYAIFGLTSGATDEQLRQAYRDLAVKFHPDRNPNDPVAYRKFAEVSEAFEILRNTDKRAAYDQARAAIVGRPVAPPPPPPSQRVPLYPVVAPPERPGAAPPPPGRPPVAPAPQALPAEPTLFSVLFGPVESEAPIKASFARFAAPAPRPGAAPPPGPAAPMPRGGPRPPVTFAPVAALPPPSAPTAGPIMLPSIEEMVDMVSRLWPLEVVWDVVRTERTSPYFRQAGVMEIDRVAGPRPPHGAHSPIEYEVADFFGVPHELVDEHLRGGTPGRDALWRDIYYPLFDLLNRAMDRLKPADLPGRFGLDWDMDRTGIDLLYVEQP